ncbi:hypothetical protein SDC9_178123 [bioreactor metagenome]|uniref:Uncharacterized protein n=1 Tax=bioreactor metagenome TaxID=1076179 RepID=A0A645GX87_9ZZZZ
MKFASAGNLYSVRTAYILHSQGRIGLCLTLYPGLELPESYGVSVLTCKGACVDKKEHRHRRLLDIKRMEDLP